MRQANEIQQDFINTLAQLGNIDYDAFTKKKLLVAQLDALRIELAEIQSAELSAQRALANELAHAVAKKEHE